MNSLFSSDRARTVAMAAFLGVVGAAIGGCVTNGRDFKSETAWIKKNSTKKADVSMVLGEPYAVGNAGGDSTWTYGYYRYKLVGKSLQKELKFWWNPDGTVNTFSFNSSFPEDMSSGPAPAPKPPEKPLVP